MKKNPTTTNAKKARKAYKKDLTEKIVIQLKTAVGDVGADLKKTSKAIEKAAKNLAKKLSKQTVGKKSQVTTKGPDKAKPVTKKIVAKTAPAIEKTESPAKAKVPAGKKTAAKPE